MDDFMSSYLGPDAQAASSNTAETIETLFNIFNMDSLREGYSYTAVGTGWQSKPTG